MKRLLSTLVAISFAVSGFAQPFTLTVDGFRSTEDPTKDYIVVQVPDCDKAALFQRAKNYFTVTYNSPQNVLSESGADAISILGAENIRCRPGNYGGYTDWKFSYKLVCEFRDGRCKITPMWIDLTYRGQVCPLRSPGGFSGGVYRKNGELWSESCKERVEFVINPLVVGLEKNLKEIPSQESGDDW